MRLEGNFLNILKSVYHKTTANIYSIEKNWKPFKKSSTRQDCPLSILLLNIVLDIPAIAIKHERIWKASR